MTRTLANRAMYIYHLQRASTPTRRRKGPSGCGSPGPNGRATVGGPACPSETSEMVKGGTVACAAAAPVYLGHDRQV